MNQCIRVLIADDYPTIRCALSTLLEFEADMQVVGEAASGDEAIALEAALNPDIVLLDIDMPGKNGFEALTEIRNRKSRTRVLLFSALADPAAIAEAILQGAAGFLPKSATFPELAQAIRLAYWGEMPVSAPVAAELKKKLGESREAGARRLAFPMPDLERLALAL
jgi:DNA-binding NarL/FixJ family response regulator